MTRAGRAVRAVRAAALLVAASVAAACTRDAAPDPATSESQVIAAANSRPAPPVSSTREREYDLTGDGVPELLGVTARGPRADSLAVSLTIRDASGRVLHREDWSSLAYFEPQPGARRVQAQAELVVRKQLDALLVDDAFGTAGRTPRGTVDGEAVQWDLKEQAWRRTRQVADTVSLPASAYDEVRGSPADPARVRALVAELLRQPTFTYHTGGEATSSVAWSPSEQRFVRVYMCC